MKKLKTIFLGTPDFSVPSLELLHNYPEIELVNVISQEDKASGRGMKLSSPPVIEFCKQNKIPFFQTKNINKEELSKIHNNQDIDLIIVLAFSHFLGSKILALPKISCFNIHTSILPKYRGAAPIQYALLNGDEKTGVSIQRMVKKMDAGDICYKKELPVSKTETGGMLYTRLKYQAALSLCDFLDSVIKNNISYEQQDETKVSFAPVLKREDGLLDFVNKTNEELYNQVRALFPWPGTFCFLNNKRLKVLKASLSDHNLTPGEFTSANNFLEIGCKQGSLRLEMIQLEGKKACADFELLNGYKNKEIIIKGKEDDNH